VWLGWGCDAGVRGPAPGQRAVVALAEFRLVADGGAGEGSAGEGGVRSRRNCARVCWVRVGAGVSGGGRLCVGGD